MKTSKFILLFTLVSSFALTCKNEDEHKLVDLSYSTIGGVYPNGWGTWAFYFQGLDSIDASGQPYFKYGWPSFSQEGADFGLKLLNKERTLYQKSTMYINDITSDIYFFTDSVVVDKVLGTIIMNVYSHYTTSSSPLKIGVFMGSYNNKTNQMEGIIYYTATWYCSYCPMGNRYRSAQVVANAFAVNW